MTGIGSGLQEEERGRDTDTHSIAGSTATAGTAATSGTAGTGGSAPEIDVCCFLDFCFDSNIFLGLGALCGNGMM